LSVNAQKELDSIIKLTVHDTTNLYNRIKWTMIDYDFIVKDLPSRDTIKTYPREFLNNDFMIANAIIKGNTIKFFGIWGSRKLSIVGYSLSPKDYSRIIYYKGCVEWKILRKVAESIGGFISFE
jgi:hypothetical protein